MKSGHPKDLAGGVLDYTPPPALLAVGEQLDANDLGKTFLRFPGPCGFHQVAHDRLLRLGPEGTPYLYLFEDTYEAFNIGIQSFGVLAVFAAHRLQPVRLRDSTVLTDLGFAGSERQILLGLNQIVEAKSWFWIPPELFLAHATWSHLRTAETIIRIFGSGYEHRLREMKLQVLSYMEEVDQLVHCGQALSKPWFVHNEDERQRILCEQKLTTFWTR